MTIKNTFLFITLFSITQTVVSQTLKTYSGNYNGGEATYQYYENSDYERIFNGKFSYKTINNNPAAYNSGRVYQGITINGVFKENKKDGFWEGSQTLTSQMRSNASATVTVNGNYSSGVKTGLWTYKQYVVVDKKTETVINSFNFNNNVLVGTISVNDMNGTLDNQGNFTGGWNIKSAGKEYIAEFQNNIVAKLIVREVADGKILLKYNNVNISYFLTDSIATIDQTRYILQNFNALYRRGNDIDKKEDASNDYSSRDKNQYFFDFFEIISERIRSFDKTIENISLGSTSFTIISPKVATVKELTDYEKQQIEEEIRNKKLEADRIEKERLKGIERKQKFDIAVSNANKLFQDKKYKEALAEYNSANAIEYSDDISAKIKSTQIEIEKIAEQLQKKRYEIYSYIKNETETINSEMTSLNVSLTDIKTVYGKNYEKCMNMLSSNFTSYFSSVNALFSSNNTNGLIIEKTWNNSDQNALDLLLKFKEELEPYEKFHKSVKTAFETGNKDQLKQLKVSDEPVEIIKKF